MDDTYTSDEFAACCSLRGYCRKKDALKWLKENGMETAHESDFQRCYYDVDKEMIMARNRRYIAMRIDDQNIAAPQNQPNSNGKSYNALMRDAQREIDATERWVRKRKDMRGVNND